jgi:uncharacterized protein YacL
MSSEIILVTLLAGVVGAALAARWFKTAPWKGAVVYVAGAVMSYAVALFFAVINPWLTLAVSMIGSGISGGILKLRSNQIVGIYLVSIAAQFVALWIVSQVAQ